MNRLTRLWVVLIATTVWSCGAADAPTSTPPAPAAVQSPAPSVERQRPAPSAVTHDLSADEAMGGHTLQRHVGKSDGELRARLEREPNISTASTYSDRAIAEHVVGEALAKRNPAFDAWRDRTGRRPNFVVRYRADSVVGRSLARGRSQSLPSSRALVVMRWDERRQRAYVLTSYPEEDR